MSCVWFRTTWYNARAAVRRLVRSTAPPVRTATLRSPRATMLAHQVSAGTPCRAAAGSLATAAASRRAYCAAAPVSRAVPRRVTCASLPRTAAAASFSVTPPARDLHLSSLTAVTPLDGYGHAQRKAPGPALQLRRRLGFLSTHGAHLAALRLAAVVTPTRWRACATCSASTR